MKDRIPAMTNKATNENRMADSSLNIESVKNATVNGPKASPMILMIKRNMAPAKALVRLGINSWTAVAQAPIGEAIKNAGRNNKGNTIFGFGIRGIKLLSPIPVAAMIPTFILP